MIPIALVINGIVLIRTGIQTALIQFLLIPVLTYGCVRWKCLTSTENKRIHFENKCLHRVINRNLKDFNSNEMQREDKQEIKSKFRTL
jgi:UPF0716 family protein affecting phage T7 exclusion